VTAAKTGCGGCELVSNGNGEGVILTGQGVEQDGVCAGESGDDGEGGSDGGEDALEDGRFSFEIGNFEGSIGSVAAPEVELVEVVPPVGCGAEVLSVF